MFMGLALWGSSKLCLDVPGYLEVGLKTTQNGDYSDYSSATDNIKYSYLRTLRSGGSIRYTPHWLPAWGNGNCGGPLQHVEEMADY